MKTRKQRPPSQQGQAFVLEGNTDEPSVSPHMKAGGAMRARQRQESKWVGEVPERGVPGAEETTVLPRTGAWRLG